ncbi:MAG: hypothetical protein DME86_07925 [Verrucomicrobia bacterium]|nr:MAG: hypothetical protein DME86_07925 [Verrucomicrobiota bacterium]
MPWTDRYRSAPINDAIAESGVEREESHNHCETNDQLPAPRCSVQRHQRRQDQAKPGVDVKQTALTTEGDLPENAQARPGHSGESEPMSSERGARRIVCRV